MTYAEITEGPKGFSPRSPLVNMQGGEIKHLSPEIKQQLDAMLEVFRKITNPQIRDLFIQALGMLFREARRGAGNPQELSKQLAALFEMVARHSAYVNAGQFRESLRTLYDLLLREQSSAESKMVH